MASILDVALMLYVNNEAIVAANTGEDFPETLTVDDAAAFQLEYIRTSAWRGYYQATPIEDSGWEKVKDGWVTGDYDDAPSEARYSNVKARLDALAAEGEEEGFDVCVVFAPTSNVFSTGYDVFKRSMATHPIC